jgi:Ran GTPase-activating protein (RanGAP) involved in mRNA processing and transport
VAIILAAADVATKLAKVTELDLSCNYIGDNGATPLSNLLQSIPRLQILALACTQLNDAGMAIICNTAAVSGCLQHLRRLDLDGNNISASGAITLANTLREGHLSALTCLDISNNSIGDRGVNGLCKAIALMQLFEELNMRDCEATMGLTEVSATAMAGLLSALPRLMRLDLEGNDQITTAGMGKLVSQLRALPRLTVLNLSRTQLHASGAKMLSRVIRSGSLLQLKELYLSCSGLNASMSIHALASAFPHLPMLEVLDLEDNGLDGTGLQAIALSLSSIPRLTRLNLRFSHLNEDDDSVKYFAEELPVLSRLKSLELCGVDIGAGGAAALMAVLPRLPSLVELDFAGVTIGTLGAVTLARSVLYMPHIEVIRVEVDLLKLLQPHPAYHFHPASAVLPKLSTKQDWQSILIAYASRSASWEQTDRFLNSEIEDDPLFGGSVRKEAEIIRLSELFPALARSFVTGNRTRAYASRRGSASLAGSGGSPLLLSMLPQAHGVIAPLVEQDVCTRLYRSLRWAG